MMLQQTFTAKLPLKLKPQEEHTGLSSLLTAAVVSQDFREKLLNDPEAALRQGYLGNDFKLSQEDAALIVSLNARSLPDLARQVVQTLGK